MDLDRLLHDPTYALPVPPDALARVNDRAVRIRSRRRIAVAAPALALALLAGPTLVGTGTENRGLDVASGPTATPSPTLPFGQDEVTPVAGDAPPGTRARFTALNDRVATIQQANNRLAARCMQEKGYTYDETTRTPGKYDGLTPPAAYRLTVEQAERRGYGFAERIADGEQPADANAAYLETLTEAERAGWNAALLEGTAATAVSDKPFMRGSATSLAGCYGEATVELWGGAEEYGVSDFAFNAPSLVAGMAGLDDDMAELNSRWARCMTQTGQPGLASPDDAQASIGETYNSDRAAGRARELTVARADATCQAETAYAPARTALEDRYLAGLVNQYADTVAYVETVVAAAHGRAVAVLDAP